MNKKIFIMLFVVMFLAPLAKGFTAEPVPSEPMDDSISKIADLIRDNHVAAKKAADKHNTEMAKSLSSVFETLESHEGTLNGIASDVMEIKNTTGKTGKAIEILVGEKGPFSILDVKVSDANKKGNIILALLMIATVLIIITTLMVVSNYITVRRENRPAQRTAAEQREDIDNAGGGAAR